MIQNILGNVLGGLSGAGGAGETDPIERQKRHAEEMANKQADAAIAKLETDTKAAIAAGLTDSTNKQSNAMNSAAKEIRF